MSRYFVGYFIFAANFYDCIATYFMISLVGISVELNPLLRWSYLSIGIWSFVIKMAFVLAMIVLTIDYWKTSRKIRFMAIGLAIVYAFVTVYHILCFKLLVKCV